MLEEWGRTSLEDGDIMPLSKQHNRREEAGEGPSHLGQISQFASTPESCQLAFQGESTTTMSNFRDVSTILCWSFLLICCVTSIESGGVNVTYMYPCTHHCDDVFRVTSITVSHSHPSLRASYVTVAEVLLHLLNEYSWAFPSPKPFFSPGAQDLRYPCLDSRKIP